ncbi:MAG: glycosyltransferase [Burkholderiaceae bacterium]|nr:glycosyltransferase [Burkholderiaceae bacterium]
MRVVHIITGLDSGGAEAVLHRLCCADTADAHTVISLVDDGVFGQPLRDAGITVHCLGMPRSRVTVDGLRRLWRLLRTVRADVVQTWMYHADLLGGVVARLAGLRRIYWGIRNSDLERGASRLSTIGVARLCALLSRHIPHRIVCCAQRAAAIHAAMGYDASKVVVIPNGYDLGLFKPDAGARGLLREEWRIPDGTCLLGMVGRFDAQKDHCSLLRALELIHRRGIDFRCVLVGTGMSPDNPTLAGWIEAGNLGGRVHLLGRRKDIPAVMNALDVHILSSRFGEAFPNVLAEAMACGTPCVTTDVGDAAEIVGDTGWVVKPDCPEDLATALGEAIAGVSSRSEWHGRQVTCRARVEERYSIDRMVAAYRETWQR